MGSAPGIASDLKWRRQCASPYTESHSNILMIRREAILIFVLLLNTLLGYRHRRRFACLSRSRRCVLWEVVSVRGEEAEWWGRLLVRGVL